MSRHRRRSERGVAIIEAAIILPLVILILLSTIEFGFAWRDVNRIEHSLQTAGRVGANIADGRFADYEVLRAVSSGVDGLTGATIERVVIFAATSTSAAVPADCASMDVEGAPLAAHGNAASACNVYSRRQVETSNPGGFSGTLTSCSTSAWDRFWCPTGRDRETNPAYLGVFIRVQYKPFTSVIPSPTIDVERTTVFRLEPCVVTIDC